MNSKHKVRVTQRSTGDPFKEGDVTEITGTSGVFKYLRCYRSDKPPSCPMLPEQFEMADKNINSLTFFALLISLKEF